jgi:hypothetical protein
MASRPTGHDHIGGRGPPQASLVMAMTIPIKTNTTIAICSHIQVGDIAASLRQALR